MVLETDGGGSTLASYVLGGTELLEQTRSGATSYYLRDGQGSTRALSDDLGAVTDTYAYTAFGELYVQTGTTINTYLYTGQQFDTLTGLYSLRARYYTPLDGRFLNRDIADLSLTNPLEYNRYVYTANNPVNAWDPAGKQAFFEYSMQNENSEAESAPLSGTGNATADGYGQLIAEENITEAQSLYRGFFRSGDNVTIAKGTYLDLEGNVHNFVGTNDFYGSQGKMLFDKVTQGLKQNVQEFIPANHYASAGDALHAEFKVLQYFEGKVGEIPANSRIIVGISHPGGICPACQYALLTESGYPVTQIGSNIFFVTIQNGIRVIFAGLP